MVGSLIAQLRTAMGDRTVRRVSVALVAILVSLSVLGFLTALLDNPAPLRALDLDAEYRIPAFASTGAMFTVGVLSWRWFRAGGPRVAAWYAPLTVYLAIDDVTGLHEELEKLVHVDWQILYLPLIGGGGVLWLLLLPRVRPRPLSPVLWVLAETALGIALVLEKIEWNGDTRRAHYRWFMLPEEVLELAAPMAMIVALLLTMRHPVEPTADRST